jgi:PAS domain-containing protein
MSKVSVATRIGNAARGFISGITNGAFFTPNQPVQQQEPDAGRIWDYPTGINLNYIPRSDDAISFDMLRCFANTYDIVRLAIETRKDQLCDLAFNIQPKEKFKDSQDAIKRAEALNDFFQSPDKVLDWSTWLRMLIEELFVIDAPVIYPRYQNDGQIYSFDVIDGATINKLVDYQGRVPAPPNPAYQQVIKGIPAVNFTRDQLVYRMRNPRVHKLYGYSHVEQIISTINIALNRQVGQLNYFTEGNVPQGIMTLPETWTPDEIAKYQQNWDIWLAGDMKTKASVRFGPHGMKYQPFKEPILKNEFDEWLARIVCFAFSLPATPFVKEVNRSTAEASQATALMEGLGPFKNWVKSLMNFLISKYMKEPQLEFVWEPIETEQDPLNKSVIHQNYINSGVLTIDEVRVELGKEPLTDEQIERNTQARAVLNPVQQTDDDEDADASDSSQSSS